MLDAEDLERLRGSRMPSEDYVFKRPQRRILHRRCTVFQSSQKLLVTWRDVTAERDAIQARERLLLVDALTGIANRRAAEETLAVEEARVRRSGTPLCVGIFDIDHFKRLNDTFGHATGDEVLREVARTIAGQARLTDTVARWGGEEFLALLPVPLEGASKFCERARRAVEALRHPRVERVTISVGIAQVGPEETTAAALERADRWLYEAKAAGRNCVRWE